MSYSHELPATWTTPKKEGDKVPDVKFLTRTRIESTDENPFDWKTMSSDDFFKGKRVVLFSLPGAFTPTCSSTHLPGYEKNYEDIKACGVDEVYCMSKPTPSGRPSEIRHDGNYRFEMMPNLTFVSS